MNKRTPFSPSFVTPSRRCAFQTPTTFRQVTVTSAQTVAPSHLASTIDRFRWAGDLFFFVYSLLACDLWRSWRDYLQSISCPLSAHWRVGGRPRRQASDARPVTVPAVGRAEAVRRYGHLACLQPAPPLIRLLVSGCPLIGRAPPKFGCS